MSDAPEFDTRWAKAPEFAEVAEALKIPTDHIVAMLPQKQQSEFTVLYTPELPENLTHESNPDVYAVVLKRDRSGILRAATDPVLRPGYWEGVRRRIEEERLNDIERRFGPAARRKAERKLRGEDA